MARKNKKTERVLTDMAAIRGVEREEHFAEGRPLVGLNGWFHPNTKVPNRKRRVNRRACRGKVRP